MKRPYWRPRLPRHTARTRLTLLYGTLFLLSGIGLLATTYALVSHANTGIFQNGQEILVVRQDGTSFVARPDDVQSPAKNPHGEPGVGTSSPSDDTLTPQQIQAAHDLLTKLANRQNRAFLTRSGVALALMSAVSLGLGWLVAGRILRPVRTITTSARQISATNLHQRLALQGPEDELKELGDTIDDLLTRLETSFQSQRRFVANASHELRTPLTWQRLVSQVALADPDATVDTLRTAHEQVINATYQQEKLLAALLTLARGERGLDRRRPIDLTDITTEVLITRESEARRRGLHLTTHLDQAHTVGDPQLVERLVSNLVDNALRYNKPSGLLGVSTTTTAYGDAVLAVTNTGPVIPAEQLHQMFQPFQRLDTDRTDHDGGLGLGLSIVQAIATAHTASIKARPLPSGGMQISVTFPTAEPKTVPPSKPAHAHTTEPTHKPSRERPHS